MSASERLREACILVLRKALFNRSVDARVTAVQGFLALCTRFTDPTLWNEITTSLQRCFSQQLQVRQSLYASCIAAAAAAPACAPALVDLLEGHRTRLLRGGRSDSAPLFAILAVWPSWCLAERLNFCSNQTQGTSRISTPYWEKHYEKNRTE